MEKRKIRILLFIRSIRSSSPNDYSYNKPIDGHIKAQREKIRLYGELELKNRLFQENHARGCQEIEELRRVCCEEADRARQARFDELSMHQERNPVSQLLTQIQDLQNTIKFLVRRKRFLRSGIR